MGLQKLDQKAGNNQRGGTAGDEFDVFHIHLYRRKAAFLARPYGTGPLVSSSRVLARNLHIPCANSAGSNEKLSFTLRSLHPFWAPDDNLQADSFPADSFLLC